MTRHLLVTNDFPPKVGGIQNYLWELWRRLDPDTFAVLTATSHQDAATFDATQANAGITIDRVPGKLLFFPTPAAHRTVRAAAAKHQADLVILDPALPLGLLGPGLGIPYAVILHGAEVTVPGRLPFARQTLARVLDNARLVISAGGYPAAEGRRASRSGLANVVEIPPGVDTDVFTPLDAEGRAAARRRLGLDGPGPLVVSVSRLVSRKGMDVLIEAAVRLQPSFPDLQVAIAGSGREATHLQEMVTRTDAPVHFLGVISEEDKVALLACADVFVMACRSRWAGLEQEGFGIVFLEAAACGVPQVAGDSGGASEAVEDGVTGIVVRNPGDPGAVADAMSRILVNPDLGVRMGTAARQRAEASFDWSRLAPRLGEAIAEVGDS